MMSDPWWIGIDFAKECSDTTCFRCTGCGEIMMSVEEADQHECTISDTLQDNEK